MPITISGSTGIAGVDGSASTPAVQGTDTNTGIAFPAADTVAVATGGSERMRVNSSGQIGIGTTSPSQRLDVRGGDGTGGISGSGGTWAAQVIMNQDASGYGGLSVQNRWANSNTAIFEAAKGWNGSAAGYYPVFQILGNSTFAAAITDGNSTYPAFFTRSWVNFNGQGTVAIRASGNVTSITDNGVGDYTVNFTNAMPDTNYSFVGFNRKDNDLDDGIIAVNAFSSSTKTTSAVRVYSRFRNNTAAGVGSFDSSEVNVIVMR